MTAPLRRQQQQLLMGTPEPLWDQRQQAATAENEADGPTVSFFVVFSLFLSSAHLINPN
jgi:hypothetical protein